MPSVMKSANSLGECRKIIVESAGEGATGACWAMIRERWHQYLFGFYPADGYWRPALAFALLFVALAPVLYAGNRKACSAMVGTAAITGKPSMIQSPRTRHRVCWRPSRADGRRPLA